MTVVNPKSISGINSITMASGSDNLLTIHANDTSEKVRVNSSGDVIVGSGVTLSPDGDVFFTGIATGNGSGLTNLATDLVNDTSPQLGGDLDTNTKNIKLGDSASHGASGDDTLIFGADDDMRMYHDGANGYISNNTGAFVIQDSHAGANAVIIRKGAEVELLHNNVLACETSANGLAFPSGKGIDFSATSDAPNTGASMSNELLDDYEEGTWTPNVLSSGSAVTYNASNQKGSYVKIGRMVKVTFYLSWPSIAGSPTGYFDIGGLPFDVASSPNNQAITTGSCMVDSLNIGQGSSLIPYSTSSGSLLEMYSTASGAGWNRQSIDSSYHNGGSIIGGITYLAA